MDTDAYGDLIRELRELITIRLAVILVPVLRALQVSGRGELASYIGRYAGDLTAEMESVLRSYDVRSNI